MRKDLSNLYHMDSKDQSEIIASGRKPSSFGGGDKESEDSREVMFGKGVDNEEMLHAIQ